jgi:hypothetical protein
MSERTERIRSGSTTEGTGGSEFGIAVIPGFEASSIRRSSCAAFNFSRRPSSYKEVPSDAT